MWTMFKVEVLVRLVSTWMWIRVWVVLEEQLKGSQWWQVEFDMFPLWKERTLHLII